MWIEKKSLSVGIPVKSNRIRRNAYICMISLSFEKKDDCVVLRIHAGNFSVDRGTRPKRRQLDGAFGAHLIRIHGPDVPNFETMMTEGITK